MAYKRPSQKVKMDPVRVREALEAIVPPNELFEIRIIDEKWNTSAYFTDKDVAVKTLSETLITDNANIYITLNHIRPGCEARKQRDKFLENVSPTTSDNDIDYYQYLMLDFDPVRVSGVSSSEEELSAASVVAASVIGFLRDIGFPEAIQGMSGNGFHALYWLGKLPATKENQALIQKVLQTLNQKCGTEACHVDEKTSNPSRVCKLYGTVAQKGENTTTRPHRLSRLIKIPESICPVTLQQLEGIAHMWSDPNKGNNGKLKHPTGSNVTLSTTIETTASTSENLLKSCKRYGIKDLGEYLDSMNIEHRPAVKWRTGLKWVLEKCPFNENHTAPDSAAYQFADGQLRFKCSHDSCKGKHFAQFIQLIDPDRYVAAGIKSGEKMPLTLENLAHEYDERGIDVKLNLITHDVEVETDEQDPDFESLITTTHSLLKSSDKNYTGVTWDTLKLYTVELAKRNKFNPVLEYLGNIEYDGCDHFEDLYNLMGISPDDTLSRSLIRKWFLQGIVLLHNTEMNPIGGEGVLTLNGPQHCGKTSLASRFAIKPEWFAEGKSLNPDDKDTARRCITKWITELGEVETTLKSDIEALKNFITCRYDEYRVSYGHFDLKYARRTNLIATCNSDKYLIDQTGNRRWWTIYITKVISYNDIQAFNIDQLWLQALHVFQQEGSSCFRLTSDEYDALNERNSRALKPMKAEDEVKDVIEAAELYPSDYKWVNITVTAWKAYHDGLKKYDSGTIGKALKKLGIMQRQNGTERLYKLPVWSEAASIYSRPPKLKEDQAG